MILRWRTGCYCEKLTKLFKEEKLPESDTNPAITSKTCAVTSRKGRPDLDEYNIMTRICRFDRQLHRRNPESLPANLDSN